MLQLIMVIFRPPRIINSINITNATMRVNRLNLEIYTVHLSCPFVTIKADLIKFDILYLFC